MTDATYARELIDEGFSVSTAKNVKEALGRAFEAVARYEKHLPKPIQQERQRKWTERRVRAIWAREARRIEHYEILDLTAVAVEEARLERQRLRAKEARLEAFLASTATGKDQSPNRATSWRTGGLDRPGIGGTDADAEFNQERWGR